jgi:hypothetical protein
VDDAGQLARFAGYDDGQLDSLLDRADPPGETVAAVTARSVADRESPATCAEPSTPAG